MLQRGSGMVMMAQELDRRVCCSRRFTLCSVCCRNLEAIFNVNNVVLGDNGAGDFVEGL